MHSIVQLCDMRFSITAKNQNHVHDFQQICVLTDYILKKKKMLCGAVLAIFEKHATDGLTKAKFAITFSDKKKINFHTTLLAWPVLTQVVRVTGSEFRGDLEYLFDSVRFGREVGSPTRITRLTTSPGTAHADGQHDSDRGFGIYA